MKLVFKTILIFFISANAISCRAQLVQTVDDAKKLEITKSQFIGKPLRELLKEIKPPIKRVVAVPGEATSASHILLYFITDSEYNHYLTQAGKNPLRIDIQVAEGNFDVKNSENKEHRFEWTKEDEEKYGKLTIVNIRVSGLN